MDANFERQWRIETVMQHRFASAIGLVAVSLVLASCGAVHQMMGTLQDLQKVQRDVGKALAGGEVWVQLNNGHFLSVGVKNSPLKTLLFGDN